MEKKISPQQAKKGFIIVIVFILLRFLLHQILGQRQFSQLSLKEFPILIAWILIGSVGLVYFGFDRWARLEVKQWWFPKEKFLRTLASFLIGMVGIILLFILNIITGLIMLKLMPGFADTFQQTQKQLQETQLASDMVGSNLGLFLLINFLTGVFQEETIFRGFLQDYFSQKFGSGKALLLQALLFSLSYFGRLPPGSWHFLISLFVAGLFYGWLKKMRRTLITPSIPHLFLG